MVSRRRILDLLAIFVGLGLVASAPAFAQGLKRGSAPTETSISAAPAYCSELSGEFRVCRVRLNEDGSAEFQIQKLGATVAKIDADFWSNIAVEPKEFLAFRGDMDLDGASEIVLVSLEGVSQGMGVSYATAYIFDGRTVESGGMPISVPLQEFGDRENFVFDRKRGRTDVLITYWADHDSIEPKKQPGLYLIGKWFEYKNAKLSPILTQPTLARRFLKSFAGERDNGWFENRKPYTWLRDARTLKLARDPKLTAKLLSINLGMVTSYREPDGENPIIEVKLEAGRTIRAVIGRSNERTGSTLEVAGIGISKNGYLFPSPASGGIRLSTFFGKIEGRRVRLETYKPDHGAEFTRIWFLE